MRISDAYQQARLNGRASRDDEIDSIAKDHLLFFHGAMWGMAISGLLWGIIFWVLL